MKKLMTKTHTDATTTARVVDADEEVHVADAEGEVAVDDDGLPASAQVRERPVETGTRYRRAEHEDQARVPLASEVEEADDLPDRGSNPLGHDQPPRRGLMDD